MPPFTRVVQVGWARTERQIHLVSNHRTSSLPEGGPHTPASCQPSHLQAHLSQGETGSEDAEEPAPGASRAIRIGGVGRPWTTPQMREGVKNEMDLSKL